MLIEDTLFGIVDKVEEAIKILRHLEPADGYYVADSGGKDSGVILELVRMAGVKFDAHHNLTTIDPPEVIYHIREHHKETVIERPPVPFLQALAKKGFPRRQTRWCCQVFKERGGAGRYVVTGIRAAESTKRAKRKILETCYKDKEKHFLNIIHSWSEDDVWEFHEKYNVPYCKLYDEGWKRIGCLFCPMAGKRRLKEVKLYPKFERNFRRAFAALYADRKKKGLPSVDGWENSDAMFDWWINEPIRKSEDWDQTVMFE